LHSHSYTGNALACAAANATLDLFESERTLLKITRRTIALIAEELKRFEGMARVKEVRQCGMIAAIELEGFEPQ
jgi:adenosylmethionine---8-amino-7-oxononanoate aminotransferase